MRRPGLVGASVVVALLLGNVRAFSPPLLAVVRTARPQSGLRSSSEEYSEAEALNMKELIISLSMEPTDHDRRTRVKEIFHEALGRPNGSPKRFTDLFDKILIQLGDEVQNEAKKKYFEDDKLGSVEEPTVAVGDGATIVESSDDDLQPAKREKSPEELQLWALVDMMVQTKTIVKKNSGELGSKGTFQ